MDSLSGKTLAELGVKYVFFCQECADLHVDSISNTSASLQQEANDWDRTIFFSFLPRIGTVIFFTLALPQQQWNNNQSNHLRP